MVERWLSAWAREGVTRRTRGAGPGELTGQAQRRKGGGFGDSRRDVGGAVKDLGVGSINLLSAKGCPEVLGGRLESREGFSVVRKAGYVWE